MARPAKKIMLSGTQVRLIHTLIHTLKIEDSIYRDLLHERYGVASSKELDTMQAAELIRDLEAKAKAAGVWKNKEPRKSSKQKATPPAAASGSNYADLEQRHDGMASPAQLRKIEAMWESVSRIEEPEARKEGLRNFIKRQARVSHIRFLDKRGASAVICALEKMPEQPATPPAQRRHRR